MKFLQRKDPYALTEYRFTVRNLRQYTSYGTILLSFAIVSLTLWLSYPTIKHLWIPTNELNIVSATEELLNYPFTNCPICFSVPFGHTLPASKLLKSQNGKQFGRSMNNSEIQSFPAMVFALRNLTFSCYSLQNITLESGINFVLSLIIDDPNATLFVKTLSENEVLQTGLSPVLSINHSMCENYVIDLSVFHAVIFDRLLINYDPRIITEVKNEPITCDSYYPNNHQNETMFSFRLRLIKGVSILTVTRFDIGTIITKFLGQLSTIVFIVGLTVVPIIYIKFEIHTLSQVFEGKSLSQCSLNVLKFLVSKYIKGYFEEEIYHMLIQQMQKLKNVVILFKIKKIAEKFQPKQFCYKNQKLVNESLSSVQTEYFQCEQLTNNIVKNEQHLEQEAIITNENVNIFNLEREKSSKRSCLRNLLSSLIHLFDLGNQKVSMLYQGQGYGSAKSFNLTILFIILSFAILTFLGVFNGSRQISFQTLQNDFLYSVRIQPRDLYFILQIPAFEDDYHLIATILSDQRLVQKQISLKNGSECAYSFQLNRSIPRNSLLFCLSQPLILNNYGSHSVMHLDLLSESHRFYSLGTIFNDSFVDRSQKIFKEEISFENNVVSDGNSSFIFQSYQVITNGIQTSEFLKLPGSSKPIFPQLTGLLFSLNRNRGKILIDSPSIFDIISNFWGLATFLFSIILYKIAKKINIHKKDKIIPNQIELMESDLPMLISKFQRILNGNHRADFLGILYYTKGKLTSNQFCQ